MVGVVRLRLYGRIYGTGCARQLVAPLGHGGWWCYLAARLGDSYHPGGNDRHIRWHSRAWLGRVIGTPLLPIQEAGVEVSVVFAVVAGVGDASPTPASFEAENRDCQNCSNDAINVIWAAIRQITASTLSAKPID